MKRNKSFFIAFICILLGFCIYLFKAYLLSLSIGALLALSTANIQKKLLFMTNNKILSSVLITLALCVLFFVPFLYAIAELSINAAKFDISNITKILEYIKNYDFTLPESLSFFEPKIAEFLGDINLNAVFSKSLKSIANIGKMGANFFIEMFLIIIFYFFANLYASDIYNYIKKVVPIDLNELNFLLNEVSNTTSVVFYSIIINAILQGFCFALIVLFYGYDGFLLGVLFAFASLIPIVGGALVYIPLCLYEMANSNLMGAIVIFSFSVIVISTIVDNFVKPQVISFINAKLLKNPAKINEMLIFFAMIAGLSAFRFWGIMLGPAIVTLFGATLKVYANFIESHKNERK